MRILCLEQGDWVKPTDYPTNGRDWEARLFGDFAINPNRRARETDYPINDANSPIKVVNFNGVGGSTIMYTAHYPRLHPSDFKVKTLDGVADDWPIDYAMLEPFFAENDRMMGVSGLASRSKSSRNAPGRYTSAAMTVSRRIAAGVCRRGAAEAASFGRIMGSFLG